MCLFLFILPTKYLSLWPSQRNKQTKVTEIKECSCLSPFHVFKMSRISLKWGEGPLPCAVQRVTLAWKSIELQGACRCEHANSPLLVIKGSFSEESQEIREPQGAQETCFLVKWLLRPCLIKTQETCVLQLLFSPGWWKGLCRGGLRACFVGCA